MSQKARVQPVTEQQRSEMLSLLYDARIDREAMATLLEAGDLLGYLRRFAGMGLQPEVYSPAPRKRRSMPTIIYEAKFDYVDKKVYESLGLMQLDGDGADQLRLYRHPEELTPEEMSHRTKSRRLHHLTLLDLLLLHEAVPDLLRTIDIAALGSLVNIGGHDYVPLLHQCMDEAQLVMLNLGPTRKISAGLHLLVARS